MKFELDKFNGVIVDPLSIPDCADEFHKHLSELTHFAVTENKNLIWLTLPIDKSHLIKSATDLGFVFHNCLESELTLIRKAPSTTFVPFIPTHTLGAGAIVCNQHQQILVIKEHGMKGYKLPGGHIELGECIESAIVREVLEETGIEATFGSIVGFTTKHPFQFGKSNLYFVCRLTPLSERICIQDTDEIADAKWVSISEYISDEKNALFNRQMVASLTQSSGLALIQLDGNEGPHKKQETFFAQA